MEIVKIRNLYKFLFRIVTKITIKRYIYSIDDDFDIWFRLEMRNDKFREFPLIPDWGIMPLVQYNSRFWFKYWFRRYKDEIENESEVDEYDIEIEVDEYEIEYAIEIENDIAYSIESEDEVIEHIVNENEVIEQFSGEVDEEATEVISCKICLVNTPKVIFTTCGHSACFSCSNKLNNCHICRKRISKKIKIFL